jgi:hypothetical protein
MCIGLGWLPPAHPIALAVALGSLHQSRPGGSATKIGPTRDLSLRRRSSPRIVDAHRQRKHLIVQADEKLTAFVELEAVIRLVARIIKETCGAD